MKTIAVSACLLGENCKYNGGNNRNNAVIALKDKYRLIPICPEMLGGLPCPRDPSERVGKRVMSCSGKDVTASYIAGAAAALKIAQNEGCVAAVLKQNSPSCGTKQIYDGTFSGHKIDGMGVTAALFRQNGIPVTDENDLIF